MRLHFWTLIFDERIRVLETERNFKSSAFEEQLLSGQEDKGWYVNVSFGIKNKVWAIEKLYSIKLYVARQYEEYIVQNFRKFG